MDIIDRETLVSLARYSGWPAISVYLPTHRTGAEKDQDRIRFKNLIKSARDRLIEEGVRAPEADALLGPVSGLLEDESFWRETSDSIAAFVSAGEAPVYRVDVTMPEQVVVGSRYFLRPLAAAYRGDERFFALAFDRNRARLYRGDRVTIEEVEIKNAPTSLAEETKYDQREESLQFTTHASPESTAGVGPAIGMFHGHGAENVDKDQLTRYASDLERAVTAELGAENSVPLVLLGVEYQLAAYRGVNTYPALATEQVLGATDELSERAVHESALGALRPRFSATVGSDLAELREKTGALVSDDPTEIVSAAATGRVKTLFFDEGSGPFGRFDRELFAVSAVCSAAPRYLRESAETEEPAEECGWDLVDLALAETVMHGGEVHAFAGEEAPVAGVAAVLRY